MLRRLEQGEEECFLRGADADDPGGDAVDAGVEVIEADRCASEKITAHQLFHDRTRRVVEDDNVVAVPAHASADVQQQAGDEEEHGRNFVGKGFRRMEMSGVEADGFLPRYRIA